MKLQPDMILCWIGRPPLTRSLKEARTGNPVTNQLVKIVFFPFIFGNLHKTIMIRLLFNHTMEDCLLVNITACTCTSSLVSKAPFTQPRRDIVLLFCSTALYKTYKHGLEGHPYSTFKLSAEAVTELERRLFKQVSQKNRKQFYCVMCRLLFVILFF